ncbi:17622_t:CDS:10 [Acaulospora colombiana]|uniref:17622_t:CDS:1 n=1 Tax=Acaulospora colombiana TaxID=27376 RepID=A0ACA9KAY3_9GLOM|nr:17622_t:CDS:10 [Acaulospora colombiana]
MSLSPYTFGSPLSSPDGTSHESGQVSLERKLRRELRKRQREQKRLEIEMELEKQAEARRRERSATLKKIEEGEEKEEIQYQEWTKKIKQLQEDGDKERQKFERELEEDILKTRKAREERRRSSSVLLASGDPLRSSRRNSVDSLASKPLGSSVDSSMRTYGSPTRASFSLSSKSKLESPETINSIGEIISESPQEAKIDAAEVTSSSSVIPESQFGDAREDHENTISPRPVIKFSDSTDNVFNNKSGYGDGSPVSPTKAAQIGEGGTRAPYEDISVTSPVIEVKDNDERLLNNLDSDLEMEISIKKDSTFEESDASGKQLSGEEVAKESETAPTKEGLSDSMLIDEHEGTSKGLPDADVKEEAETKKDSPKTPGRLNINEIFKEKESNVPPLRPKPEPPRKKTSLFTAMFEEAQKKKHESEGSSKSLSQKMSNPIVQTTTTTVVETVTSAEMVKNGEKGVEATKVEVEKTEEEEHKNQNIEIPKKGDLPRTPGRLNVKELFKARIIIGKESNAPAPLKPEPQRKKISFVGTVFEDLQRKNESNLDVPSKSPILPAGKKFSTTTTVSSITTVVKPDEVNRKDKGVVQEKLNSTPTSDNSQVTSRNEGGNEGSSKSQASRKAVLDRLPWMNQKSDDISSTSLNSSKSPAPRKLASPFLTSSNTTATTTEQSKPRIPSKLDNSISQKLEGVFGGKMPLPGMGRGGVKLGGRKVSLSGEDGDTERVKVMVGIGGNGRDEMASTDVKGEKIESEETSVDSSTSPNTLNHVTRDRPRPPGRSRPPTRPTRTVSSENKENKRLDLTESKSIDTSSNEKGVECIENTESKIAEKSNEQTLEVINTNEIPEEISVGEQSNLNNDRVNDNVDN